MLKPLLDKVVVKMIEAEETTKSGLILAANSKGRTQIGEVIEVGPGGIVEGNTVEMCVKKGDIVVLNKFSGTEIKYSGEDLVIVRQNEILAVIE